ncbi:TAXI family TRAP transporter solute-binding subunit [Azospirillum sp. ST 5-10]|uniref:TAXI family TRAP transporter solute-binding subunit n=1 Tax=unclassified Azospirillum TaxID=2630922 RepID=UPI003F4A7FD6
MRNVCAALLCALALAATAAPASAEVTRVVIGTAGTAGALYPMGVAMAESINRHSETIRASAEATAGSLANIRNLANGELQWAISANDVAYQAYTGAGAYEGRAVKDLQGLFGTVGNYVQVFAPADSAVDSIADFRGKRIGVGAPGSGGEQAARALLAYFGLSYDDVDEQFMEDADMATALQDGQLDAFIITHPLRSAPLLDLTTSFRTKLVSIADDGFYKRYPYFSKTEVKGGTYDHIDGAATLPVSRIVMYTTPESGLSDGQVYEMLGIIWDHASEWQDVHAAVKSNVTLERALQGLGGIPLHPAAARFYRERGLALPQ